MKAYLRGRYGQAPGPVSAEILERVLGDEKPISCRPAELVTETLDDYREEIGDLARSEEDLLSFALFPQTARAYLERHRIGPESDVFGTHDQYLSRLVGSELSEEGADRVREILGMVESSEATEVTIEEGDLKVTVRKSAPAGRGMRGGAGSDGRRRARRPPPTSAANGYHVVRSPMVGTFYRASSPSSPPFVEIGASVTAGQTLCILEAMKLMNELAADVDGIVREIEVEDGQPVQYGQALFHIEPV